MSSAEQGKKGAGTGNQAGTDQAGQNAPPNLGIPPDAMQKLQDALKAMGQGGLSAATLTGAGAANLLGMASAAAASIGGPFPAFSSAPDFLPDTTSAVLLVGFHPQDQGLEIANMLSKRGYNVAPSHRLDLATLRNLPSQKIGVLYIHTHGMLEVTLPPTGSKSEASGLRFGLATEDLVGASTSDPALLADINLHRVQSGWARVHNIDPATGLSTPGELKHVYYATDDFFEFYWKSKPFAQNSFVYVDGCWSAEERFGKACGAAGAGMVLGWTFPVDCNDARLTANFIFDRMLGTNEQKPGFIKETLPQRPFNWTMLAQDIKNHHYPAPSTGVLGTSVTENGPSELFPAGTGALLVPSIIRLQVDERNKQLQLYGDFCDDPGSRGTVQMLSAADRGGGGRALSVSSWGMHMITCELPSGSPGASTAGTSGYAVVAVDGRQSNAIPLTEWTGQIVATATGDGSIQEQLTIDFSLRADAHLYRRDFGQPAVSAAYTPLDPVACDAASYSTCKYAANGSASYDPPKSDVIEQSVSGNGEIPAATSEASGPPWTPTDTFDVSLGVDRTLDTGFHETDVATLGANLALGESTQPDRWTKTQLVLIGSGCGFASSPHGGSSKQTTTVDIAPMSWWTSSALLDRVPIASFQLPSPEISPKDVGDGIGASPWKTVKITMSSCPQAPPDPSKGEEYIPVLD